LHDVIVSGGGPAGAYAAYECAKRGLSVLILDKGARGRKKCCAGGLLGRTISELDFPLPDSIIERRVKGFSFVAEGIRYSFPIGHEVALIVRRENFDAHLVDKAEELGVDVLEGVKVQGGIEHGSHISVSTTNGTFDGSYLVIAEGASSHMADMLCGKNHRNWAAMGCAVEARLGRSPRDEIDLHLSSYSRSFKPPQAFPLTGAVFPLKESVIVSFVGRRLPKSRFEAAINNALKVLEREYGELQVLEKPCFHPLPILPRPRLHSNRALVVGDSAGLVSPFSGEGLTSAFLSAKAASEVLIEAVEKNTQDLGRYDSLCAQYILGRLRAAGLLGPLVHYAVNLIGHQRLFSNLRKDDNLVRSCAAFALGEMDVPSFAIKAIPRIPGLVLGR
jgi:geranylgeranyl reductase family protein